MNGTDHNHLPTEIRNNINIARVNDLITLSITASAVYNGTTVQCVAGRLGGDEVEIENVILTIQGIHTIK